MLHTAPIHLVGPGGAGKSTVGVALARRLGVAFLDLDEQFKARAGDSVPIWTRTGTMPSGPR